MSIIRQSVCFNLFQSFENFRTSVNQEFDLIRSTITRIITAVVRCPSYGPKISYVI